MSASAARTVAFEILLRVESEDSYAVELLHSSRLEMLSSRDRALATELVIGALRWQSLLDHRLAGVSSERLDRLDREVLVALRLGVYQLEFLTRVPARAAIFESVELVKAARKRSAAAFVNAVLRKVDEVGKEDVFAAILNAQNAAGLAHIAAHPAWLVERWVGAYGLERARRICSYDQKIPATTIRIHGDANTQRETEAELAANGLNLEPGQLLSAARTIIAGDVIAARAYQDGRLSIQDEGSQLVALVASDRELSEGGGILDCCAAPGGKTGVLARRHPRSRVFATELHPHRARLLRDRIHLPNVQVLVADAGRLPFAARFERILVDVPCSGTGTLARNPEIKWRLKPRDLLDLQARQATILKAALAQLAASGRLVYSTCSLEPEENEAVVEAVLDRDAEFELVDMTGELERLRDGRELPEGVDVASLVDGRYLRTIPGVHDCDGFFAAMIRRKE
jgi:16S rRNA (cytosine967-C5)-methyltransferase